MNTYTLPDLPYAYTDLEPNYSSEILQLHHGKHHAGYVKGANDTLQALAEVRERGEFTHLKQLQKDLAFNISGHVLHSMFWQNMTPGGNDIPNGALARCMERDFGGFDAVRDTLTAAATSIQGSGWAVLAWEPLGQRLIVEQVLDHQDNSATGSVPLLVLDMWEHAFYLQFRNVKKDWVKSFWEIANWKFVAECFDSVSSRP